MQPSLHVLAVNVLQCMQCMSRNLMGISSGWLSMCKEVPCTSHFMANVYAEMFPAPAEGSGLYVERRHFLKYRQWCMYRKYISYLHKLQSKHHPFF